MLFPKYAIRLISIVVIIFLLNSCVHYFPPRVVDKQEPIPYPERTLHVFFEGQDKSDYYMSSVRLENDALTGELQQLPKPAVGKGKLVNLYLIQGYQPPSLLPAPVTIPMDKVSRLEVYDLDLGLTIFTSVLLVALTGVFLFALLLVIIALTKESCPFIYVYDGEDFEFTGEIFSGAVLPSLERHDYLPLPSLQPRGGYYELKMTNEVHEIQYPNLAELEVVDHPKGTQVLLDRYGNCQSFGAPQAPLSARDRVNADLLPLLAAKDGAKYNGDLSDRQSGGKDEVFLSFQRPAAAKQGKLLLRANNSFWLDYVMGQFFDLFGDNYSKWFKQQQDASRGGEWSLEQGIPLSVYVKQGGQWKYLDHFNVIGSVAAKDVVMACDLSGVEGGTVELKLECGYLFWELDYAAMDFSPQVGTQVKTVGLASATDSRGRDVKDNLAGDDDRYFTMPETGEQALLSFAVPAQEPGTERTVFLHSKGYYEVLRAPSGKADLATLYGFRKPGRLSAFSRERFEQLKECVNR
jgi:hypothetical protein